MSTTLNLALAVALSLSAQDPPAAAPEAAPSARTHYALVGATVHSMVPGEEPAVRTVVVNQGRIEAVLAQDAELPEGLERLDLGGLHLSPGLIDGHVNHDLEHDSLYVSRGVTLVRDTGNHVHNVLQFRLPEIRDLAPGPDLYICGPALTGLDQASTTVWGLPSPRAASEVLPRKLDELEAQAVAMGLSPDAFRFDYLMFRNDLTKETAAALVRMAHGRGIEVWGYMPVGASLDEVLVNGQDGLISLDGLLPPGRKWNQVLSSDLGPAIGRLAKSDTAVMPMLAYLGRRLNEPLALEERLSRVSPVYEASYRPFATTVAAYSVEQRTQFEAILMLQRQAVHELWRQGATLLPGSGAPFELLFPGDALLDELDQWVAAGIPSGEVLRLATAGAAEVLGVDTERGTIAPGMIADLVALGRDPSQGSLAPFRDPELVVVRGRLLERWDLEDRDLALVEAQTEARQHQNRELEIDPPDMPPGTWILSGRTQSESGGQRVSAEHFAVVETGAGGTAYGTRMILPGSGLRPEIEVHLVQTFQGDRLESFELTSQPIEEVAGPNQTLIWSLRGHLLGTSNRMSIQRKHTLSAFGTVTADQTVSFVDFSDTLTALILGRHLRAGTGAAPSVHFPLLFEGNQWEPLQDRWGVWIYPDSNALEGRSTTSGERVVAGLNERGIPVAFQRARQGSVSVLKVFGTEGVGAPPKEGRVLQVTDEGDEGTGSDTDEGK